MLLIPPERFRLNNLAPQPGSRRPEKRKGRGYGAGQGGTCGFGMRGQRSRSGPGVRPGFEGGQMPLYRRLPKLKGIAGGESSSDPVVKGKCYSRTSMDAGRDSLRYCSGLHVPRICAGHPVLSVWQMHLLQSFLVVLWPV